MHSVSYRALRRVAAWMQAVLALGLPFVRVSGESALRFDIPSLKLYFFGSVIWISEATFFLLVFLLFFIGVLLFTALYGRIWCGWMCPQSVLSGITRSIERTALWFTGHHVLRSIASHALLVLFSTLASAGLIGYFVSPYDVFTDARSGSLGPWTSWSWVVLGTLTYLNLAFMRQAFCGSVCPIAGFQDAKPVIGYLRVITSETDRKGIRSRIAGLSAAFAFIAALFAYEVFIRMPVDFWVMRDEAQAHHNVGIKGVMLNAYVLVVENRSLQPESYRLTVSGISNVALVVPQNPLMIPPNTSVTMKIYVSAKRKDIADRVTRLRFTLESTSSREIRVVQEAPFIYPDRTDKGLEI
jgi:polyferredoxin